MKKYIIIVLVLVFSLTSCATAEPIEWKEYKVAGYTLKNKKELMQQKITKKKNKTVLATP